MIKLTVANLFNSLWYSDAIWWHNSESILVQSIACCSMPSYHHLNQCWIIIKGTLWHSPESNFTRNAKKFYPYRKIHFKITATSPRGQWANSLWPSYATWRHWSGMTLDQVMACCLMAPSHYLNQCWVIISKIQWYSSKGNFTRDTSTTNHQD